ncbi:7111_t:CDS:2 [Ambispora leptoticha]|uniref:7111_t:CDS:1 n=1 Tax=Ambispora leptoticha TaxID=144679 RepID=A0A9N9CHY3_9GLOM|nr:7111_t:CDS:2 [Ambispora leptoticha]
MKDDSKDGPFGRVRFVAAKYFSTRITDGVVSDENVHKEDEVKKRKLNSMLDEKKEKSQQDVLGQRNLPYNLYDTGNLIKVDNPLSDGSFQVEMKLPESIDVESSISVEVEAGVASFLFCNSFFALVTRCGCLEKFISKSTMEPKDYSTIRSILKGEQGEKVAPYVFKVPNTKAIQEYLDKERITYEIYQQLHVSYNRYINPSYQEDISGRNNTIINEYEKAHHFLEVGCGCGCSAKLPKEEFAELREDFQALTKPEQHIFLMAQLKAMDGGAVNTSRRLKNKTRVNKRTVYC